MPSPGWDLDKTLNLSGLKGTFTVPDDLFFLGADGQGQAIRLEATVAGRLLHLTGGTATPFAAISFDIRSTRGRTSCRGPILMPMAALTRPTMTIWQQHFGSSVAAGADGDANGDGYVDATDYTVWRDQLGQSDAALSGAAVPEPGAAGAVGDWALGSFLCRRLNAAEFAARAPVLASAALVL